MAYQRIHSSYIPSDNTITEDVATFNGAPPRGYASLRNTDSSVANIAKDLLGGEYGTVTPFEVGPMRYMARVEPHYHDPNGKLKPHGWHKGVTVYVQNSASKSSVNKNKSFIDKVNDLIDSLI